MATASETHDALGHPVIDADGHGIEYLPWFRDLLRDEGGGKAVDGWNVIEHAATSIRNLDANTKRALGTPRMPWWGLPTEHTLDRATAMFPKLLYERLDELGIDLAVCYPTYGLTVMGLDDPDVRVAAARAFNRYYAHAYVECRDRLEPVAIVPTYTPDEAIATLDHAVGDLGLKAVMCTGLVQRPLPGDDVPRGARWVDALGLDSVYDYDPLWQRFVDLDVVPTFHSTGMGWGSRTSPTSYVANHLGSFAAAGEALCRALYLGGVMTRFPTLRFAFLEGGVTWAASLCADLVGHFEKRHCDAILRYDPARVDCGLLEALLEAYGDKDMTARADALQDALHMLSEPDEDRTQLDEFATCGARSPADIREVFARQCFFGCEADDPMWPIAFAPQFHGTRLNAMFASDLGHWDVPDARDVLPEAWALVEHGHVTASEFRAFTYDNALALWGEGMFADSVVGAW
jgi:predicted TIM-barrel fold metal-dependent hydrolase